MSTRSDPQSQSDRATEVHRMLRHGEIEPARQLLASLDKSNDDVLTAAMYFYLTTGDWESASHAGLLLLTNSKCRSWSNTLVAAYALHNSGQSRQALMLLGGCKPAADDVGDHHYQMACMLAALGHHGPALLNLLASMVADDRNWVKAFVDRDMRELWQRLGDQRLFGPKVRECLADPVWLQVLKKVSARGTRFTINAHDLDFHPKWKHLLAGNASAMFKTVKRPDRASRTLDTWLRDRSRWAISRLLTAIRVARSHNPKTSATVLSWLVGRTVRCVDSKFSSRVSEWFDALPEVGRTYTISGVFLGIIPSTGKLDVSLCLAEVPPLDPSRMAGFSFSRFRVLRKSEKTAELPCDARLIQRTGEPRKSTQCQDGGT